MLQHHGYVNKKHKQDFDEENSCNSVEDDDGDGTAVDINTDLREIGFHNGGLTEMAQDYSLDVQLNRGR
jgi:hypothetical protein